jgi:hypothetical protein
MHRARVLEVRIQSPPAESQRTIRSLRYAVDNDLWATLESMIAGVPVDGRRSAANRARRGVIGVSLTSGPIARTASRTALAIAAVGATAAPSPLRALVISFSATSAEMIVSCHLNRRGRKPDGLGPLPFFTSYPEPGVLRKYCGNRYDSLVRSGDLCWSTTVGSWLSYAPYFGKSVTFLIRWFTGSTFFQWRRSPLTCGLPSVIESQDLWCDAHRPSDAGRPIERRGDYKKAH